MTKLCLPLSRVTATNMSPQKLYGLIMVRFFSSPTDPISALRDHSALHSFLEVQVSTYSAPRASQSCISVPRHSFQLLRSL